MGSGWCLGLRWEVLEAFRRTYGRGQASRSSLYQEVLQQADERIRQGLRESSDSASLASSESTAEDCQQGSRVTLGLGCSEGDLDTRCSTFCSHRIKRFPVRRARGAVVVNRPGPPPIGAEAHDAHLLGAQSLDGAEASRIDGSDSTPDLSTVVPSCAHEVEEDDSPHLQAISASLLDEWRRHLLADHTPYRRDCATCVQAKATGFRHKTVKYKNPATLSLDVAGPFKVKGKPVEGSVGRELPVRYLLVGSYRAPEMIFRPDVPEHPEPVEGSEHEEGDPSELEESPEEHTAAPSLSEAEDLDLPELDDGRGVGSVEGLVSERDAFVKEVKDLQRPVEMKTVVVARAMASRKKQEVLLHIQEMVIELRRHGLVVSQVHSDRARELLSGPVRKWLAAEGIDRSTTTGIEPAANGAAESAVKWIKGRIRALLFSSAAPVKHWPSAAQHAVIKQMRERLPLGDGDKSLPTFFSTVYFREKRYGINTKEELMPRWTEGNYLAPSRLVSAGHCVLKSNGEIAPVKGLKPYVVRIEDHVELPEFEAFQDAPARRVKGKTSLVGPHDPSVSALTTTSPSKGESSQQRILRESEALAKQLLKEKDFSQEGCHHLLSTSGLNVKPVAAARVSFPNVVLGGFTHGGLHGVTSETRLRPNLSRYLNSFLRHRLKQQGHQAPCQWTSLALFHNPNVPIHRDVNNHKGTCNYATQVTDVISGGIWVQDRDSQASSVAQRLPEANVVQGSKYSLDERVAVFDPKRFHYVVPPELSQWIVSGFTPRNIHELSDVDRLFLQSLGFAFPKASLLSMILGETPDASTSTQTEEIEPVKLRALRPPAAQTQAALLLAPPVSSASVDSCAPPAVQTQAVLLLAPPVSSASVDFCVLADPEPLCAADDAPGDETEHERAGSGMCCAIAGPYADAKSTGLGRRIRFLSRPESEPSVEQTKDLPENLCQSKMLGRDGCKPAGVTWSCLMPGSAPQHQDASDSLGGFCGSDSVVLGEGQVLPKGDRKSLDHNYATARHAGPSKATSFGQNRSYSVKPNCARGRDFPKGCRKSSCFNSVPIKVGNLVPSWFPTGSSLSFRPKLQKLVGPVEDSVPVARTPRGPRERRRHRLIYAYTEAHRLSEGAPTNWQEIPPLIANQPLPEDSFSVIPAALWIFRDRDWQEDPELEYFDDQDRAHPLARVLQGSMTILPAVGDIIAMFEFLEYATGVRWFMVLRRVSVGTDGPANARDDDEPRDLDRDSETDDDDEGPENPGPRLPPLGVEPGRLPRLAALRVQSPQPPSEQAQAPSTSSPSTASATVQSQPWASQCFRGTSQQRQSLSSSASANATSHTERPRRPRLNKTAPTTTKGIEDLLSSLTEPLGVVHTVDAAEVRQHLPRWRAAVLKELESLLRLGAIKRHQGRDARRYLEHTRVQPIPSKVVWTVKPPEAGSDSFFKRKARIVACGNFEAATDEQVFASGTTVEVLRLSLTSCAQRRWSAGAADIRTAFLLAPVPTGVNHAVYPPAILQTLEITSEGEVWQICKALYGFRESPRYWCDYRNQVLQAFEFAYQGETYKLRQGRLESNLWIVYRKDQPESSLEGYVLVYVDDLLFMAPQSLATALHKALAEMWEISNLEFASKEPLRFLGVEIGACEGGFWLCQSSYIDELLRSHNIRSSSKAKIPAPREWLNVDPDGQQENPSTADVRLAQRYVGELLWLSQRARPDLQFTVAIAASLALHQPKRVAAIAMRTLAYLQSTRFYRLRCVPTTESGADLVAYSDASYAPTGGKSHGCAAVFFNNVAICWRSSRQPFTTLSTAESELVAASEAALMLISTQALVTDVLPEQEARLSLRVDNKAAVSISSEGMGSWRTRHLKIRYHWLREKFSDGSIGITFVPGTLQRADIGTKPLPGDRLKELMIQWGFVEPDDEPPGAAVDAPGEDPNQEPPRDVTVQLKAISAWLCALTAASWLGVGESVKLDDETMCPVVWEQSQGSMKVDYSFELYACVILVIVGWELVRRFIGLGCR